MKLIASLLLMLVGWRGCLAQEPDAPDTPVPNVKGDSALKWMGIAVNVSVVAGLLFVSCWLARPSKTRPSSGLCPSLRMLLPPKSKPEAKRLFSSDLRLIVPTEAETNILSSSFEKPLRPLPSSLLCWRRTQLTTAMIFYFVALMFSTINISTGGSFSTAVPGDEDLSDTTVLRKHFKEQMLEIIPFSQSILSFSFYSFAAYRWHDLNQSRFLTVAGFCLTFLMPFVFFTVPWMEIDSPQRMVQDMCKSLSNSGLPIVTAATGVRLNSTDICGKKAHEIGDAFTEELLLNIDNGSIALSLMGMVLKFIVYVPTLTSSFIVMKSLAPGVLGILMGLQGGLRVSKITFPGARLTTWLLVLLQAAALPVTMFLCAIILIVVGTYPTMFTAIFMTISVSLYIIFHKKLLRANKIEDAIAVVGRLNKIALVLKVLAVGCLLAGIWQASHIMALKSQGMKLIENALKPQSIIRMAISFLAGLFSSKVVFTDVVLHIIISTYVACFEDSIEDRNLVMKDLILLSSALKEYENEFNLDEIEQRQDFSDMGQLTVAAPMHELVQIKVINDASFSNTSPMLSRPVYDFSSPTKPPPKDFTSSMNPLPREGRSFAALSKSGSMRSGSMYVVV
eukprot:TRINITY_DN2120_c0_g1_i7.p1 TRINITY_DN2120_c0_g1~~TRINITY_DN2120_c0_g1_i7.p1  ORF type:complete len:621 (+),score=94.24 TRINITY_DN2120_c0_g1_i7:51-1913(+)